MYTGKCYVSELSRLEFVKVGLSKIVTKAGVKKERCKPVAELQDLYDSLLETLRSSGLNIITAEATRISRQRWKLQIG